jgi:hypothetical protein
MDVVYKGFDYPEHDSDIILDQKNFSIDIPYILEPYFS